MGYDVFRGDELVAPMIDALSFYDDDGLEPETEYAYSVVAIDDEGNRSDPTTVVLNTPAPRPPGALPSNSATLTGGGNSSWSISDGLTTSNGMPSGGGCSFGGGGAGVGIIDAWIPLHGDAYDHASLMFVNGEQVGGFLRSASDSTTNFAPVTLSNLEVTTEYHAISTQAILRNLTSFNNETSEDIFVIINHVTNFGSDGATSVDASSSGDLIFDPSDRWVLTDDNPNSGDPTNITVFAGPDSPPSSPVFTSSSTFNCAGTQGLNARIDLLVPAGEQRSLLLYHSMSPTGATALDAATQFDITPVLGSDLVEGLTQEQLLEVANWRF